MVFSCVILDLSSNLIKLIHEDAFKPLSSANTVKLDSNKLSDNSFPKNVFERSSKLEVLTLTNNSLAMIPPPEVLNGLKSIVTLSLSSNQIVLVKKKGVESIPTLRRLHLDDNRITILEPQCFDGLKQLRELDLSNNKIKAISNHRFDDFFELEKLDLSKNEISAVEAGSFSKMTRLKEIDFSKNKIEELDSEIFAQNTKLHQLR